MAIFYELPVLNNVDESAALPEGRPLRPKARPLAPSKAAQILASRKPEWLDRKSVV